MSPHSATCYAYLLRRIGFQQRLASVRCCRMTFRCTRVVRELLGLFAPPSPPYRRDV
jgi:hypothetical protein